MILQKQEIQAALSQKIHTLLNWFEEQPAEHFIRIPETSLWSAGQHLHHLIKATQPLNKVLRKPRILLRYTFGKPNREGRTYPALVKRYQERLAQGGQAPSPYIAAPPPVSEKEQLLYTYEKEKDRLIKTINSWREKDLDRFILPHPLMGKLLIREMLFFTIHHNEHHLSILKRKYEQF